MAHALLYNSLYRNPQFLTLRTLSRKYIYRLQVSQCTQNSFTSHIMYEDKYKEPGLDVD